ncbi:sugar transferase [Blastococcus sp. SYSU D00813]
MRPLQHPLPLPLPEPRDAHRLVRAAFDRGLALLALLLVLPVLVAVAVAVRATSPGPALRRSPRLGRDGRAFGLLTFRTTVTASVPSDDGVLVPLRPETVTPVGRFLRRHALDELPQLLNVLGGQMSLVGPRPREVAVAGPPASKPGLLGTGDDDAVPRRSLPADLTVLGRALRTALRGDGG